MPRQRKITVQNNFSKGLVTEATGLTFPENACTDTDNCTFNHFGLASRRLGFDLESGFEEFLITVAGNVVTSYLWTDVASEGDLTFVVVQIGNGLHFYRVSDIAGLSTDKHATVIDLTAFVASGIVSVNNIECQFSDGNGLLFVTNEHLNTFFVEYNVSTNTFSTTVIDIQIRDLEGDTADTEVVDSRPTSTLAALDPNHRYNLENQGWTTANLTAWDTAQTTMPSNADVNWYFKSATNAFDFSTAVVDNRHVGNSPAPKGHFKYNLYNIDRNSKVSGATNKITNPQRLATSAFFAGRVFYTGLKAGGDSSKIYFSQIVERREQYGQCYQVNDPTSEELFDLLPSDGGVIDIIEAGGILKMIPVLNTLVVFCSNGVWAITGSQGTGFTANDYSIHKISSVQNISHTSFVLVEGIPYWWNLEGIYTLKIDPQTNSFRAESVSDNTIRTFYLDIPSTSKETARGVYDQFDKKIQWIYKSESPISLADKYTFDRVLTLDLLAGAYFPWSVDTSDVKINSIVNVFGFSGEFLENDVVDGANDVFDGANDVTTFSTIGNPALFSVIKYFVSYNDGADQISWAQNYQDSYLDWESFAEGLPYSSFFRTGYVVRGEASRKFQQNYINIVSDGTTDSSYEITGQWDYAETGDTGRWSSSQIIKQESIGYSYKPYRVKIRGHGKAFQFQIDNNEQDAFNIIGWSVAETGNEWI